MGCFGSYITKEEHDKRHVSQCIKCGADIDEEGFCVEMDNCEWGDDECDLCGYTPCDESC